MGMNDMLNKYRYNFQKFWEETKVHIKWINQYMAEESKVKVIFMNLIEKLWLVFLFSDGDNNRG